MDALSLSAGGVSATYHSGLCCVVYMPCAGTTARFRADLLVYGS
jgi:hypothetical protein